MCVKRVNHCFLTHWRGSSAGLTVFVKSSGVSPAFSVVQPNVITPLVGLKLPTNEEEAFTLYEIVNKIGLKI